MTTRELFFKKQLLPLLLIVTSLFTSVFYYYEVGYYSPFGGIRYAYASMWGVLFSYYIYTSTTLFYSRLNFLVILISVIFFIIGYNQTTKYKGFPSIKEAKFFYMEKKKLETAKRLQASKAMYQQKMQELQEDKKKFL
jgi:hypothetical protein